MPLPPALGETVIVHTCAVTAEAERQARQAIRRLRREQPGRAHRRHRLRRADATGRLRRHARGRPRARQCGEAAARELVPRLDRAPRVQVGDIMAGRRRRRLRRSTAWSGGRAPSCRSSRAATTAAPSASSPIGRGPSRSVPLRGHRRPGAARWSRNGYRELVRHRRRHHRLRRRPAGQPEPRRLVLRDLLAEVPELRRLRLSSLDPAEHRRRAAATSSPRSRA